MQYTTSLRRHARSLLTTLLLLLCAAEAYGYDTYSTQGSTPTLSIASLAIGSATFSTVVISGLTIADVIPPAPGFGGTPNGSEDTYDPATQTLFIPSIYVDGETTPYTNVSVTLTHVTPSQVTFTSAAGTDTYGGGQLFIPSVQVGGNIFVDVLVNLALADVSVLPRMGMPGYARDQFNNGSLIVPMVVVNDKVYTNAVATITSLGDVASIGGIQVPNVVGLTQAAATAALAGSDLTVGLLQTASSVTVPAGSVIGESPGAGATAALGSAVNLTLSLGATGAEGGLGSAIGWVPFVATAVAGASPAGQNGLFVVPAANPLVDSGANVSWVIPDTPVVKVGEAFVLQTGAQGTGHYPYVGIYAALNSNNVVDMYAVDLTNASSSPPAPLPIGNFTALGLTAVDMVCSDGKVIQTNLLDPTSLFMVVHINPSGVGCYAGEPTDYWVVVTASTTTTVNIASTGINPFYNPNAILTGMVLQDPVSNNLYLYPPNSSFTNPVTLMAAATTDQTVLSRNGAANAAFTATGSVQFRLLANTNTPAAVYRLDYTGASSFKPIPGYSPSLTADTLCTCKTDDINVYIADTNSSNSTETLYQEPVGAGGSAPVPLITLYSGPSSAPFTVLGSNTQDVFLHFKEPTSPATVMLGYVPVGVSMTSTPTQIGPTLTGNVAAALQGDAYAAYSTSALYVEVRCTSCSPPTDPYSTEILGPDASAAPLQALTTNSALLSLSIPVDGYQLEIKGVTDPASSSSASQGGGNLYDVPSGDGASSYNGLEFTTCTGGITGSACSGTGTYTVPAGAQITSLFPVSTSFVEGLITSSSGITSGLVANMDQQLIGTVSLTNTNIAFGAN